MKPVNPTSGTLNDSIYTGWNNNTAQRKVIRTLAGSGFFTSIFYSSGKKDYVWESAVTYGEVITYISFLLGGNECRFVLPKIDSLDVWTWIVGQINTMDKC